MKAAARFHPFDQAKLLTVEWTPGMTLAAIARKAIGAMEVLAGKPGTLDWFMRRGIIRVGGRVYKRSMWAHTRPKDGSFIELLPPAPTGGKAGQIALILATVVLTVGTAFIAAGGLTLLGASAALFGANTLGASLAAAAFGLGGSFLLQALTPAPTLPSQDSSSKELSASGITGNPLSPGDLLMAPIGRIRMSPHMVAPPFTELVGDKVYINAVVGCVGPALVEDILVNGVPIDQINDVQYEVRSGTGSEADTFLSNVTGVERRLGVTLTNAETNGEATKNTELKDQTNPANSLPKWERLPDKEAEFNEYLVRIVSPGSLARDDGQKCTVAFRIETRLVGSSTWRALPTFHLKSLKSLGHIQQEFKIVFGDPPSGLLINRNDSINMHSALYRTGVGQSFEYLSDSYFNRKSKVNSVPVLTGYTSGSVTVSASSETTGNEAWRAFDGSGVSTSWITAPGALPATLDVDWGAGNEKALRTIGIDLATVTDAAAPNAFQLLARNSPSDPWDIILDTDSLSGYDPKDDRLNNNVTLHVGKVAAYRYHRLLVTSVRSGTTVKIGTLLLSTIGGHGAYVNSSGQTDSSAVGNAADWVNLSPDGAKVYLTTSSWPAGQYEFQIKRSWAFVSANFSLDSGTNPTSDVYKNNGSSLLSNWFGYNVVGGKKTVSDNQDAIQSTVQIVSVVRKGNFRPIREEVERGIALIAFRAPNIEVRSISALYTGFARKWSGTTWDATPTACRNPAAYMRDALLKVEKNARPIAPDILDTSSMEFAYEWADTNGFTCDTAVHQRNVTEVLRLLATSMRGSPRQADMWGVVIDRDRTADPITGLITPETSRNLGCEINYPEIPHGYRVSYLDETQSYEERNVMVYRDGYSALTATDIRGITDRANTNVAAVTATALYNLRQMAYRSKVYTYEVGFEGRYYARGDLVGVVDESWAEDMYYGLLRRTITSAGNVTGFELWETAELSKSIGQPSMIGETGFAVAVRQKSGAVFIGNITNTTNTKRLTLVTPVSDTGQFAEIQPVSIGPRSRSVKRLLINAKQRSGEERWTLSLLPEAPEIFE